MIFPYVYHSSLLFVSFYQLFDVYLLYKPGVVVLENPVPCICKQDIIKLTFRLIVLKHIYVHLFHFLCNRSLDYLCVNGHE